MKLKRLKYYKAPGIGAGQAGILPQEFLMNGRRVSAQGGRIKNYVVKNKDLSSLLRQKSLEQYDNLVNKRNSEIYNSDIEELNNLTSFINKTYR